MVQRKLDGRTSLGGRTGRAGRIAIVLCQHVLLWTALYIAASTMYTLIIGAITVKDIPSVVLLLVSVSACDSSLVDWGLTDHIRA